MADEDKEGQKEPGSWREITGRKAPLAAAKLSGNIAQRFGILPVAEENGGLVFLARAPLSEEHLADLRFVLGDLPFRFAAPQEYPEYHRSLEQLLSLMPVFPAMIIGQCEESPRNLHAEKSRAR